MECGDYILNLAHVFKGKFTQMPVVHNKPEVILDFDLVCNFSAVSKCFTHDCNQHVGQMNEHDEA